MFGVWKRQSPTPDVVLYTKADCPLCDEAKTLLDEIHKEIPFTLIVKDIASDETARKDYANRVPVVVVNGHEVAGYPPDKHWVKSAITTASARM
jgi:glutaredoxin